MKPIKIFDNIHKYLFIFPVLWIFSIYSYFGNSRLILGYWPTPYHPDPKTRLLQDAIGYHYLITIYLRFASIFAVLFFILLLPFLLAKVSKVNIGIRITIFAVTILFEYLLLNSDPGNIFEWYFD